MNEGDVIRSKDNGRLAYVRSVRDGREPDAIFIEGKRQCIEAARAGTEIELCLFADNFDDEETIANIRSVADTTVTVAERLFDSIAETKSPQGVIAIAKRPTGGREKLAESIRTSHIPTIVFLSEINNPSNLGAIFRTVEAAGAAGLITSIGSADAFSPKANRAALGSNLRTAIWEKADDREVIEFAKDKGISIAAAVVTDSTDHISLDWTRPTLLMFGSEAHGLGSELMSAADSHVTIPMANGVESLNIAVSAGIFLFEAVRQNRAN